MMTNLFSIFEPTCGLPVLSGLPLNWVVLLLVFVLLPPVLTPLSGRLRGLYSRVLGALGGEVAPLLGVGRSSFAAILLPLFMLLLTLNGAGLMPYVFTPTSHPAVTLGAALPIWAGIYISGWSSDPLSSLAHLTPVGTPSLLIPFMVLVEGFSGLIRPFTLMVRLAANMVAGHLLLALVGGAAVAVSAKGAAAIVAVQVLLTTLEAAVALIQAYVFTVLCTLYASEV